MPTFYCILASVILYNWKYMQILSLFRTLLQDSVHGSLGVQLQYTGASYALQATHLGAGRSQRTRGARSKLTCGRSPSPRSAGHKRTALAPIWGPVQPGAHPKIPTATMSRLLPLPIWACAHLLVTEEQPVLGCSLFVTPHWGLCCTLQWQIPAH